MTQVYSALTLTVFWLLSLSAFCQPRPKQALIDTADSVSIHVLDLCDSANHYTVMGRPDTGLIIATDAQRYEMRLSEDSQFRLYLHHTIASALQIMGATGEAIPHVRTMVEIGRARGDTFTVDEYHDIGRLGGLFMSVGEEDSCLQVYREAVNLARAFYDQPYYAAAYNNLGMGYQRFGHFEYATNAYEEAVDNLGKSKRKDSVLMGAIIDNQGSLAEELGNPESALAFHQKNRELFREANWRHNRRKRTTAINLLRLMLQLNQLDPIPKLIAESEPVFDRNSPNTPALLGHQRDFAGLVNQYYERTNQSDLAQQWAIRRIEFSDSLFRILEKSRTESIGAYNQYRLRNVAQEREAAELASQKADQTIKAARQQSDFNRLMAFFVAAGLLFSVLTIYRFFRRRSAYLHLRKQATELQLKNQSLERERLQEAIEHNKKDLNEVAEHNNRQWEWTEQIGAQFAQWKTLDPMEQETAIIGMIQELKSMRRQEDVSEVRESVSGVNEEFHSALLKAFPALTPTEKELCGMIRLNLSGREIANLRNVDPRSVTKSKNRLRKKLNLGPAEDLYAFLQEF